MKLFVVGSASVGFWGLLAQLPPNLLLTVVLLVAVLMFTVLFHEPACARLIRIIKAFTEVRQLKER